MERRQRKTTVERDSSSVQDSGERERESNSGREVAGGRRAKDDGCLNLGKEISLRWKREGERGVVGAVARDGGRQRGEGQEGEPGRERGLRSRRRRRRAAERRGERGRVRAGERSPEPSPEIETWSRRVREGERDGGRRRKTCWSFWQGRKRQPASTPGQIGGRERDQERLGQKEEGTTEIGEKAKWEEERRGAGGDPASPPGNVGGRQRERQNFRGGLRANSPIALDV